MSPNAAGRRRCPTGSRSGNGSRVTTSTCSPGSPIRPDEPPCCARWTGRRRSAPSRMPWRPRATTATRRSTKRWSSGSWCDGTPGWSSATRCCAAPPSAARPPPNDDRPTSSWRTTLSSRSLPLAAAWHRAEASSKADRALAEELVRLADDNRSKAGYAAASAVLERAALLAGDATRAAELLAGAAEDALLAGDVPRTRSLAGRVLDDTTHAASRGRALVVLGVLELTTGSVPRAAEMLGSAVEVAEGAALVQALSELSMARFRLGDMAGIADCAARMDERARPDRPLPPAPERLHPGARGGRPRRRGLLATADDRADRGRRQAAVA